MGPARTFQEHLLAEIRDHVPSLSERVCEAFLAVPRHLFVDRFLRGGTWQHVGDGNLAENLPTLYRNDGLAIHGDDPATAVTISTPSFVLDMLELLRLAPGQAVFELGTGSGWNAALLGHLVAPGGSVETIEIIPDLIERARRSIARVGITNVRVTHGDGAQGPATGAFDRAVFTAGSYDIPRSLHERVRVGGLLLFVLKIPGGGDVLVLFRREQDGFVSLDSRRCEFVPVTGPSRDSAYDARPLSAFEPWHEISKRILKHRPLLCGTGSGDFATRTFDLRSFLSIAEPRLRYFDDPSQRTPATKPWAGCTSFGLWDDSARSLALVHDDRITTFGSAEAGDRLEAHLRTWLALGMPSAAGLSVRAHPRDRAPSPTPTEWAIDRKDTRFIWSRRS